MKNIETRVQQQCRGEERKFLLDTIKKEAIYFAKKDKASLEKQILRVNLLYDGLSESGKKLAKKIVEKIMEDMKSI